MIEYITWLINNQDTIESIIVRGLILLGAYYGLIYYINNYDSINTHRQTKVRSDYK